MDCLLDTNQISKELYRSVSFIAKLWFFKENDLFQENEQNEQISVKLQIPRKLKIYQIVTNFQKRASYRLVY